MSIAAEPIPDLTAAPPAVAARPAAVAVTVLFLSAVAWFAHFSGWRQTGFFSDDHSFAVLTMAWTPGDARHFGQVLAFSYPEPQGRPVGFLLGLELPYLGYHVAGVFGMFAVGWVVLSGNAVLLWTLLARRLPRPLPVVGALVFLLFPADTTRPFLCHAHILQPSLTFALVAAQFMLCRRWWVRAIGYPIAGLCLVTYETALLPLLALPLLDLFSDRPDERGKARPSGPSLWNAAGLTARFHVRPATPASEVPRRPGSPAKRSGSSGYLRRRLAGIRTRDVISAPILNGYVVHVAALMAMIGVVAITRSRAGEYRAGHLDGGRVTVATEVVLGSIRGPLAAAQACVRRPWQQAWAAVHRPAHGVTMLVAAAAFAGVIGWRWQRAGRADVGRALIFGLAAIGVSYLLCFTHYPPTCEEGQSTSVHTAAAIGFAAVAAGLFGLAPSRRWVTVGAALYFGLLFGHATDEQAAYADLWHERQAFWTRVLALCPDLTDRTVIVCDGTLIQRTWYMPANLWSDAMVPAQVYQFPASYRLPPILAAFPRLPGQDWRQAVRWDDAGRLTWRTPPCNCPAGQVLNAGDTILLHVDNAGGVSRVAGPVDVAGRPVPLRAMPPAGSRPAFPHLPFYAVLTGRPG